MMPSNNMNNNLAHQAAGSQFNTILPHPIEGSPEEFELISDHYLLKNEFYLKEFGFPKLTEEDTKNGIFQKKKRGGSFF